MSLSQLMSSAMATDLFQSVGVELTIFAITLIIAATFRGTSFGKRTYTSQKKMSVSRPMVVQADQCGHGFGQRVSADIGKPVKNSPPPGLTLTPTNALSQKIESMIDCANRRQAVDAIAIYEQIRANGEASSFKDALRRDRRHADVFNLLVQCAGRASRPELVEIFLDDMTHAGIDRPLALYEGAMKMLASKKCYKEALSVCSRLEADGLEPSPVTLSCLINFAAETGEADRAICFFKRLAACSTPSIRAYMTVLRLYSRRQDWQKSLALLRDMQKHQTAIVDSLVLNVVLATGVAACEISASKALLDEFSQCHIADVVSYNTVMKGLAQHKEGDKAIKLLDEMCHVGLKPNAITFNTAMDAAVRSERVVEAWAVLARMRDVGVAPDKFTCTTLVKGLQSGATPEQLTMILDLLRNVTAKCDGTLCGSLFRCVIEAAARVNDPDLTARAVAQMREQRVMLPANEYQRLLQVLLRDSEVKHCSEVYRKSPLESMRPVRVM